MISHLFAGKFVSNRANKKSLIGPSFLQHREARRNRIDVLGSTIQALIKLMLVAGLLSLFSEPVLSQGSVVNHYFYDGFGRLVSVVDSSGNIVTYTYDASGNI